MKGDFTRSTFKPRKHYSGVRMQQGRVQLDADWNEQIDIAAHRTETETIDVIGGCGAPMHNAGFALTNGLIPKIAAGRYYVDGILCENEADVDLDKQPDLPVTKLERFDHAQERRRYRTASTSPTWMSGSGTSPRWRMTASVRWRWAGRTRPRAPRPSGRSSCSAHCRRR